MSFSLSDFLKTNREAIIHKWVHCLLTQAGDLYSKRPRQELLQTVSEAYDANTHILLNNDFSYINQFIKKITRMRLEAGFPLSNVQMAFEFFRSITLPMLSTQTDMATFAAIVIDINRCLTHTIHRFSDHFQSMQQRKILEHNQRLEEKVRTRTAALKESELKYKVLVEEINDGYFVVQNKIVVFANRAFCHMHGYRPADVIGKPFHVFIDPKSREKVIRLYDRSLLKTGIPRTFEYLRLTRNGNSYPTEILAKMTYYDNKPSNIGICRDITDRVHMEQKVRETERMAYIGQITTSLSHEIRNPLSSVQMNLQILKKNPLLKGNDQRRIDISVNEVQRLEHILRELLDFAKPIQLNITQGSLNHILRSAIDLLEMKFSEAQIALNLDLDSRIPTIWGDKEKLGQALINLLLNALEASSAGGRVSITSKYIKEYDGLVEMTISDRGNGVPEAHIDDIFKPFFTTKSKGTGLGLSMVKRIAEAHKGRIQVENQLPSGAAFKLYLPV